MKKQPYHFIVALLLFVFNLHTEGQEKIWVHTDRNVYVAGENMFFKCYLAEGISQQSAASSQFAYLVLRNEQNSIISNLYLRLNKGMAFGNIYLPDTLSTGRYQLISYTNCMKNQGEQSFFVSEIIIANRFDKELTKITNPYSGVSGISSQGVQQEKDGTLLKILPEKRSYLKREKIKVNLEIAGIPEKTVAYLSVSVREVPLHSLIEAHEEDPRTSTIAPEAPDLKKTCTYLPEINGIIIRGKITDPENQHPFANTTVFLSTPDTVTNLQFTRTDASGTFRFRLNDYYNQRNIIIRTPNLQKASIEMEDKFAILTPFKPSLRFPDSTLRSYLLKSQSIVQVQKTYQINSVKELPDSRRLSPLMARVYPSISNPVFPEDFVNLPDFVEISREILPLLRTRKHKNKYTTSLLNESAHLFFDAPPLICLDGVPIDDVNQIISLNTDKIKKIETIGKERYLGGLYFQGILSIFSKKMEINNIVWESPILSLKSIAYHPSSVFQGPDYTVNDKSQRYSPDFRQVLDWEPTIALRGDEKKTIEFFASDNTGEFEIIARGMTTDGSIINAVTSIRIISNIK
jgi:hypothetical protein